MAHTAQDDGFHEIQLNGKQLFFLFMATTVVSVAIFLVGVMVGRGVRAERATASEAAAQADSPSADPQPALPPNQSLAPAAGVDLTMVAPPPPADETADIRPNTQPDVKDSAKPDKVAAPAPEKAAKADKPATAAPTAPVAPAPAAAAASTSAQGWVVQVAALNTKNEADAQVKSLTARGYGAYVATPQAGKGYRVRVGGFKTRGEANAAAAKLGKEIGVTPWVTTP